MGLHILIKTVTGEEMALGDTSRTHVLSKARVVPIPGKMFRNAPRVEAVLTPIVEEHVQIVSAGITTQAHVQVEWVNGV